MESLSRLDSSSKVPAVPRESDRFHTNVIIWSHAYIFPLVLPKEYADAVSAHARQGIQASLYPGLNFANLASFLQQPFRTTTNVSRVTSLGSSKEQSYAFARQYTCNAGGAKNVESFQRPEEFSSAFRLRPQSEKNHSLLFLQGLPSSQWLSTIGGAYRVDPEFFQRHLDFWSTVGRINYFPLPSLPSTSENMIQLSYISIGQRENPAHQRSRKEIGLMRQACMKAMSRYTNNLNKGMEGGYALGNSIVRGFDVLDEAFSIMEQRISIYFSRGGPARTSRSFRSLEQCHSVDTMQPWSGSTPAKTSHKALTAPGRTWLTNVTLNTRYSIRPSR